MTDSKPTIPWETVREAGLAMLKENPNLETMFSAHELLALARAALSAAPQGGEDKAIIEFLWKWIDRMARGELSVAECLNVLTHYPAAPEWVLRYTTAGRASGKGDG